MFKHFIISVSGLLKKNSLYRLRLQYLQKKNIV
jgi:hypothetical protein